MLGLRRFGFAAAAVAVAGVVAVLGIGFAPGSVSANPHAGQSVDVAVIGSPGVINGGHLTVTGGVGDFGDFNFTNVAPASVSAANLAAYDTAVLNVASSQMGCNVNTLSASAKTDLAAFVSGGGKMIIYDSECSAQDYSWLPYPFTTNNPGAYGAHGILTIAEENILASASVASPHYIDAVSLGDDTDAVGDMNVMTTLDPHWCLSMSGTNVNEVTGPVHAYARYGSGLIIYNGLDVDYMGGEPSPPYPNGLEKIWLQELQAPLNASQSELPCGILVIGTATPTVSPSGPQATPCIGGIVSSRCPSNPPEVKVTPAATATLVPPTIAPTSTVAPVSTVLAAEATPRTGTIIAAPNTGSGPDGGQMHLGWLLLAVGLLTGGAGLSAAARRLYRR